MVLHAGILLSHDSPHPLVHSVVWGIHRFPCRVAVFGARVYERVTNSLCAIHHLEQISLNSSSDRVVPGRFRVIHMSLTLTALVSLRAQLVCSGPCFNLS